MLTDIKDYKLLKKSIVRMYKKYVNNQEMGILKTKIIGGDSNLHAKFTKDRKYLEDALNSVTSKLTKSYQTFE